MLDGSELLVVSDYIGEEEKRQLEVKAGDIVSCVKTHPGGWSLVRNAAGKIGYVPTAYLKENPSSTANQQQQIALYDFLSDESNQLNFRKGDIIIRIKPDSGGWSTGYVQGNNSKVGIYPSSYVKNHVTVSAEVTNKTKDLQKGSELRTEPQVESQRDVQSESVFSQRTTYKMPRKEEESEPRMQKNTSCRSKFCNRIVSDGENELCPSCRNFARFKSIAGVVDRKSANQQAAFGKNRLMYLLLARLSSMSRCKVNGCDNIVSGHQEVEFCTSHFKEYFFLNEYPYEPRKIPITNTK